MITLEFRRDPLSARSDLETLLSSAAEWELRHCVVLGDLYLVVDEQSFATEWGWVPLLDVASKMLEICSTLRTSSTSAMYEFISGSDAYIMFEMHQDSIIISANYISSKASIAFVEFQSAVLHATRCLISQVLEEDGEAIRNDIFRNMFDRVLDVNS